MRHVSADYLGAVYEAILRRCGASTEEARQYAQCFLNTDLHGKDTQGIALVPLVYPRIRRGAIRFGAPIKVVEEGPNFAIIDGGYGPGPVVATKAMEIAIEKARAATLGAVWIRNTNAYTMAADYPMMALEHDFFGFAACNGVPLVEILPTALEPGSRHTRPRQNPRATRLSGFIAHGDACLSREFHRAPDSVELHDEGPATGRYADAISHQRVPGIQWPSGHESIQEFEQRDSEKEQPGEQ